MKLNKIIIFSIFLIAIVALGAANASDDLDALGDVGDNDGLSIDQNSIDETVLNDNENTETISEGDNGQNIENPEDELSDYDYNIKVPDTVYPWEEDTNIVIDMPSDANGNFNVSIDEEFKYSQAASAYRTKINFKNFISGLEYDKEYTLNLNYYGDAIYKGFSNNYTFKLNYIKFEVPEEICTDDDWGRNCIKVTMPYDATGKISLFLDGKEYKTLSPSYNDHGAVFYIGNDFKSLGKRSYEIRYYDGNYENASKAGSINFVYYQLRHYSDNIIMERYSDSIDIIFPFDVFGTVKLIADGKEILGKQVFDYYGDDITRFSINLSSLEFKRYDNAKIVYSGDSNHVGFTKAIPFNLDYLMEVYSYGDIIGVNLPKDITGSITLKIANKTFFAEIVNGEYGSTAEFENLVPELTAGNYTAVISYAGDSKYPAKNLTLDEPFELRYMIHANTYHNIFEDTNINLTLPNDATGSLFILVDDGNILNETIPLVNGFAGYTIPNDVLGLGDHKVVYKYIGDDYNVSGSGDSDEEDYPVIHVYPVISIPDFYVGQNASFVFQMPTDANGNLTVWIDNTKYTPKLVNGKATLKLPNTKVKQYGIAYEYKDSKYGSYRNERDTFFEVRAIEPNVTCTVPSQLIKNSLATIKFSLPKTANGNIVLYLKYENKTITYSCSIIDGAGSVKISPIYQGKVRIYYDYSYGNYRVDKKFVGDFKVLPPLTFVAKDLVMKYSSGAKLKVKIYDSYKNLVKDGQTVYFYLNGKKIGTAKTKKGTALFKITLAPKTYKIKIVYKGASITKKVTVKSILTLKKVKVKKSAKKLVLTASLKKVNGKYLKGKKITFKFNGKTYRAKTNKKGVAKVTIKRKVLKKLKVGKKIKIQATYIKNTAKRTAKVKK